MRNGHRRRATLPLIVFLTLLASACREQPPSDPRSVVVAVPSSPTNLDPRIGTDEVSQKIGQLIFNTLTDLDDQLRVVPGLASSWTMPDDRTYIVSLRRGVLFHDGHELTAADVVFTFNSLLDPAFVSARKGAYRMLDSVRLIDRYTVEFTLKEPFGSFPVNLVMPIVPAGAGAGFADRPIGTGPYRFVRQIAEDRVELAAFDRYFEGPPKNAGVVLRIVPDEIMRGLELRKGSVDLVVNDLAPDVIHQLERDPRLQIVRSPGTDYQYLGFNLRDPVLRDRRVRQAIGYAIDRGAIITHLRRGLARTAVGILPPASWAFRANVFDFAYDSQRSKRLLDQAGYADPDGDGPKPRLRLSLKTSNALEFNRLQAEVIQQDLARVGIALDVRTYEFATLYADVLKGNFQTFTLQWVGVSDPDILRRVFHSNQMPPSGFNRGSFSNSRVDRIIDRATSSTDDRDRQELYGEVQEIVAEEAPYISLWYKTNAAIARRSLEGIRLAPAADFTFLKDVSKHPEP